MNWTKKQIRLLTKLVVEENASNARIQEEIAKTTQEKVTKGMIAGKITTLGLSGRRSRKSEKIAEAKKIKAANKTRRPRKAALAPGIVATRTSRPSAPLAQSPILSAPPAVEVSETPPTPITVGTATILTLRDGMCKWPIGDPAAEGFTFCGRSVGERLPNGKFPNYCVTHRGDARKAPETGRRRGGGDRIGRVVAYYS